MRTNLLCNPLSCHFARLSLLAILFLFALSPSTIACDRSSVALDSVVAVGNEYDIYVTLCIGGGISGVNIGADNDTYSFSFGFYSTACTPLCISEFPPSITGDSTQVTAIGVDVGAAPQPPFGTQGNILYQAPTAPLFCISNITTCGSVHTQCDQYRFRMNAIPDSLRVFGIEGAGNPVAGCYPNSDMVIDFTGMNPGGVCCNDTLGPSVTCPSNDTAILGANCMASLGNYTAQASATDNCTASPTLTQMPAPGTTIGSGFNTVTITGADCAGNSNSCSFVVFGVDPTPPTAICQSADVYLDGNGNGTLIASQVDGGSTDDCGISSLAVNPSQFGCGDVGANTVVLTVIDNSSNMSNCTASILVYDTIAPTASCQSATISLNGQGVGTLNPAQLNDLSSDACGTVTFFANNVNYTCADFGPNNPVVLTVTDAAGNSSTCSTGVYVDDAILPTVTCPDDTTITGSAGPSGCGATYSWPTPNPTDNCGISSLTPTVPSGSYFNPGLTTVIYTATDIAGNTAQCSFNVMVNPPAPVTASYTYIQTGNLSYSFMNNSSPSATSLTWDFGDGNSSTMANPTHVYATGGTYTVCLIASDGCSSDTTCLALVSVGRAEPATGPEISLYPNPNGGEFYLDLNHGISEELDLEIMDVTGRLVWSEEGRSFVAGERVAVSAHPLATGTYTLQVSGEGWKKVLRLVVE